MKRGSAPLAVSFLLVALATATTPIGAQSPPWAGELGLGVLVVDDSGAGVPGAAVVLQWGEAGNGGPAPVLTGADGRAEITGLAAGEWQVEVRREGFMMFTGYLSLDPERPPDVGFTSRQRTGTFWAPLEVSFARAGAAPEAFVSDRASERAARRAAEEERRRQEREERRAGRGDFARLVETEEPESEEEADRPPEPSPEAGAPEAPAAAAPGPVPAGAVESGLLPPGACRECGPGEWTAIATEVVGPALPGIPGCSGQSDDTLTWAVETLASPTVVDPAIAGRLSAAEGSRVLAAIRDASVRAELQTRLAAVANPGRSCLPVAVVLPAGSRYVGYRLVVADDSGSADCRGTESCGLPQAAWVTEPALLRGDGPSVVWALFENLSERLREAELRVYFVPPDGWLPGR